MANIIAILEMSKLGIDVGVAEAWVGKKIMKCIRNFVEGVYRIFIKTTIREHKQSIEGRRTCTPDLYIHCN